MEFEAFVFFFFNNEFLVFGQEYGDSVQIDGFDIDYGVSCFFSLVVVVLRFCFNLSFVVNEVFYVVFGRMRF